MGASKDLKWRAESGPTTSAQVARRLPLRVFLCPRHACHMLESTTRFSCGIWRRPSATEIRTPRKWTIFDRRPVDAGEAKVEYLDGDFFSSGQPVPHLPLSRDRRSGFPLDEFRCSIADPLRGLRHALRVHEARVRAPVGLADLDARPSVFLMDSVTSRPAARVSRARNVKLDISQSA